MDLQKTSAAAHRHARLIPENRLKEAIDEQTNKVFAVKRETNGARAIASIAGVYLIVSLAFYLWVLFDTLSGNNSIFTRLHFNPTIMATSAFRLTLGVVIGGALGGTLDAIRSFISWHAEREAYGAQFIWKDISHPFLGAAVALFVYAMVVSGVGIIGGNASIDSTKGATLEVAIAIGALTGFSSWKVFRWLDGRASRMFTVASSKRTGAVAQSSTKEHKATTRASRKRR